MTAITQISNSTVVTAAKYNEIQSTITNIIVNEYGYANTSASVSQYDEISAAAWAALKYDIDRCSIHRTNATIPVSWLPNNVLQAAYVNALITSTNESVNNKYTAHPAQLDSTVTTTTSPSGEWVSNTDTFYHTWNSETDARIFFALGGKITVSMTTGSTLALATLINEANAVLATKSYSAIDYNYSVPVTKNWVSKISGDNSVTVTSTIVKSPESVVITTVVNISASAGVILDASIAVSTYWSKDRGGDVPGFNAQPPIIQANDGGESAVRLLTVSPATMEFSLPSGSISEQQTLTLTNAGNASLDITDIIYTSSGGVTAIPEYPDGSPVVTILAGQSFAFNLAYSGNIQGGPYVNTITVVSPNNDRGNVIINATQQVNQPIFNITLGPSTSDTVNTNTPFTRRFLITANRNATPAYSATLSGNTDLFSITSAAGDNPIAVTFTPTPGIDNQNYAVTLTVTATESGSESVTRTADMTVTYDLPATANLGNWLSPAAQNNSIVGMSYDVIAGNYYLTVGIGALADIAYPPGILPNSNTAILTNLDYSADIGYSDLAGPALYPMLKSSKHIQFLQDYGVWIRQDMGDTASLNPVNSEISRSYQFTVSESKTYNWLFSVDDFAYFTIDGVNQGNLTARPRRGDPRYWSQTQSGSVYLTSGTHTIKFYVTNAGDSDNLGNPGGIAIRLYDPAQVQSPDYDVWNTLRPVRVTPPYLYWNQVFRIPITGNKSTYRLSRAYSVKDTDAVSWADYAVPIMEIEDNGVNILRITFNQQPGNTDPTVVAMPFSPYYYVDSVAPVDPAVGVRINNLDGGPVNGSQTRWFTGFAVTRNVDNEITAVTPTTRLVQPYPGYGYVAPEPYYYESGPGPEGVGGFGPGGEGSAAGDGNGVGGTGDGVGGDY